MSRPTKEHLDDDLEAENDAALHSLHNKVKLFKGNIEGIEGEVREQNRLLDDLENAFARSRVWFKQGFSRLASVSESPITTRTACYFIAALVVLFLLMYWLFGGDKTQ